MYQVQPQDFSFIAQAGRAVGSAIEKYPEAQAADKLARDNKIDKDTFDNKIWPAQIAAMQKKATDAGVDSNTALSLSVKYAQKRMSAETPSAAAARLATGETLFNKALDEIKVQNYHKQSAGGQTVPQGAQAPGGTMTMKQESTPEQARSARLEGQMTPTTELARPGGFGYGELPGDRPEGVVSPSMSAQDRYTLAQKQGILKDETVYADVAKTGREELAGTQFPQGTTSSDVYQKEMQQPVLDKMGQELHTQFPSQKDVMTDDRLTKQAEMTNERLTQQADQRARLSDLARKLGEKKLALEARKQGKTEEYKLLENQIDLINTQIRASEQVTKTALGISTGKDMLGQTTFYTGPEIDAIQKDNESTLSSAQDLLERVNKKNESIIPPTKPAPLPKNQYKDPLGIR